MTLPIKKIFKNSLVNYFNMKNQFQLACKMFAFTYVYSIFKHDAHSIITRRGWEFLFKTKNT
jgi:hypothetical protein